MCGIVGAVAERNVTPILIEGLKRLEYRGYDSAGVAVYGSNTQRIDRVRVLGKVANLVDALKQYPLPGQLGIAHTRWATHGEPSERNAHPHFSHQHVAVVHNGIIENHRDLKKSLQEAGYAFDTETDTEVVCHLIHQALQTCQDHQTAIRQAVDQLHGAYALGIIFDDKPDTLYGIRRGSPLVIGVGIGEHFLASDQIALLPVTQQFIDLEEGELAILTKDTCEIQDAEHGSIERDIKIANISMHTTSKGQHRHYMAKEIYDQPTAITDTLANHIMGSTISDETFGHNACEKFPEVKRVLITACGTSHHAGLVARYWLESLAGIPCTVEVASEYRYRESVTEDGTLFVALSQSGETADTLAALKKAKTLKPIIATLAICNVAHSSLVRESDLAFITQAGIEIGVAATKTFTTQLTALLLLTLALGKHHHLSPEKQQTVIDALHRLPALAQEVIALDKEIEQVAQDFTDKHQSLYLGRCEYYAIALEGALKLKEISYMHAEAYPSGELKHGPLALVDNDMPVIVLAPMNTLLDKLASNMKEVEARGGHLYVVGDETLSWDGHQNITNIHLPAMPEAIAPIVYTIPLQLLAYHIAILKGTDVDQPRNLAKSVTVE